MLSLFLSKMKYRLERIIGDNFMLYSCELSLNSSFFGPFILNSFIC